MGLANWFRQRAGSLLRFPSEGSSPERYSILRRNMMIMMLVVTIVPLCLMAAVNYVEYQKALKAEILSPLKALLNKTKHSFELFLTERTSAVSFIASAYPYSELEREANLARIFTVMREEFGGFVDLGLIDDNGIQVSYSGPYQLRGKDYSEQTWFQEVQLRGVYTSEVFLGYRHFPHIVIAVHHPCDSSRCWTVRATINTEKFDTLIASMGLEPESDAFLVNRDGILQTPSKYYGKVLDTIPMPMPPVSFTPNVVELTDPAGRDLMQGYVHFISPAYVLMVLKPKTEVLKNWYALKSEILFLFVTGVVSVFFLVFTLTNLLVKRVQESDEKREAAFREMEHTHKLSSIGRLAAGVAHEINNPLAIINEKTGLMKDLLQFTEDFPQREKFLGLVEAILKSVNRCRGVTHRLLGFAKRMEVSVEILDINDVVREVLGFLEKEALYRNIEVILELKEDVPRISSDRGQLQQVFLNILNNSFAAVEDGGKVTVRTWDDRTYLNVAFEDNGCGMSEETQKHIFEPFFTTKKTHGTGLGLSITYGIVRKLGGQLEVKSQEGIGTTFTIHFSKTPVSGQGD